MQVFSPLEASFPPSLAVTIPLCTVAGAYIADRADKAFFNPRQDAGGKSPGQTK
jgi:hypothetical protein